MTATDTDSPAPDAAPAVNAGAETVRARGRLKVFFGMCAGVGKTYAMLQDARREREAGADVVAGVVETHGRQETEALLDGLPVIPRRRIAYRGVQLEEFDLDAVLARRPHLVLVDELAHTNAPGSRHLKRYQDIEELLNAGISVTTTLNVQHLESRADVVRQITGVGVRETVPDSILVAADEIQVVDLTPDDLRERLAAGKVYLGAAARVAATAFFKPENLAALREMALRAAAEHTDSALRDAMRDRGIAGPWKAGERLLVAVGPSPSSESLIRWTRRIAGALDATWLAVSVETEARADPGDAERIAHHLALARTLGAETLAVAGATAAPTIIRVAREQNVTQIVVGKTQEPWWRTWPRGGSLTQQIIAQSGLIDVCVVQPDKAATALPLRLFGSLGDPGEWVTAGLVTATLTVGFFFLARSTGYTAIAPLYLLWVVVAGLRFQRAIVLAVAACCALLWNFLFISPLLTFEISTFQDAALFVLFFVVALAIGHLTARLRAGERAEQRREHYTSALYELARQTALAPELRVGLEAAVRLIEGLLPGQVALSLRQPDRTLAPEPHPASTLVLTEKERGVAVWVFSRGQAAGRFTDTLRDAEALHLPLQARTGIYGVLSIRPAGGRRFDVGERNLLDALAGLIAAILEKEHFIEAFRFAEVVEASEQLRRAVLNSVSHELKTPLAAVQTGFDTLLTRLGPSRPDVPPETVAEIRAALRRLHRVIGNLLDMTRIQTGYVRPKLEWADVEETIDAALDLAGEGLGRSRLVVEAEPGLPLVKIDQALIEQALCNLLVNAATWSPPGAPIVVSARCDDGMLSLRVIDHGPGIAEADLPRIFETFYRAPGAPAGGTGLGLSIVQGFVKAHCGTVQAANNEGGGACFTLRLPVETLPHDAEPVASPSP